MKRKSLVFIIIGICIAFAGISLILIINNSNNSKENSTDQHLIESKNDVSLNNNIENDFGIEELPAEQEILDKIVSTVEEFGTENGIQFQLNMEQMEKMIEFYKNTPNNFNSKSVGEYLISQGWVSDSVNNVGNNEKIKMPDLVGMNYGDLRTYLDNNGLSFITDIKYRTDKKSTFGKVFPYKVLSTIPASGEILNPSKDTSITVLTTEVNAVETIKFYYVNEKDWHSKYFGKTMKIQIGSDENSVIEGVVGKDFNYIESPSHYDSLLYNKYGKYLDKQAWNQIKEKKVTYFLLEDLIKNSDNKYYVKGTVWVDNQLIKEIKFFYNSNGIEANI